MHETDQVRFESFAFSFKLSTNSFEPSGTASWVGYTWEVTLSDSVLQVSEENIPQVIFAYWNLWAAKQMLCIWITFLC